MTFSFNKTRAFAVDKNKSILIYMTFLFMFGLFSSFHFKEEKTNDFVQKNPNYSTQNTSFNTCQLKNKAFRSSEKLTHKVFYNWNFIWMGAGTSTAVINDFDDQQYMIDIKGNTLKSFDWFYKIRDHYTSTINKKTLTPSSCMRYIEEGKYTLYDKVDFDKKNNKATSIRGKSKVTAKSATYDVEGCMHDLVSMVYYLRNVNFKNYEKGDELPMQIFMDRKTWNVQVRYEGRKLVKVKDKGKFIVNKVTTRLSQGELFDENSYISVYISTDKNQIPLLVKLELTVGSIQVVLTDYENLKHPFSKPYVKKKS